MVHGVKMRRRGWGLVLMCVALASGCASAPGAAQPASAGEVVSVASPSPRPRLIPARAIPKAPLRLANPLHQDVLDALRASPHERGYGALIEALACAGALDQAQQVRALALEQLGPKARLPWARTACAPRAARALVGRIDEALTINGIDAVMAPELRGAKLRQLAEEAHARGDVALRDHALDQLGRLWRAQPGGVGIRLGRDALWAEWSFGQRARANATGHALLARPLLPQQDCYVHSPLCVLEGIDEGLKTSACEALIEMGARCLGWDHASSSAVVHYLMRLGDEPRALSVAESRMNEGDEGGASALVDAAIEAQRYELALQAIALFYSAGIERRELMGFRARVRLLEAAYKSRHPQHAAWEQEVVNDLSDVERLRGGNEYGSYRVEAACVLAEYFEATGRPKLASARWRVQRVGGFSLAISLARAGRLVQAQQVVHRSMPSLREALRDGEESGLGAWTLNKLIFQFKSAGAPELMPMLMAGLERGADYGYARVALLRQLYEEFKIEPQQLRRFLKYTLADARPEDRASAYEGVVYTAISRGMVDVLEGVSPEHPPAQLRALAIKLAAINLPEAMRWMRQLEDSDMRNDALIAMLTSLHENKRAQTSQREALLQEGLLQYRAAALGPQRNALWRALIRALLVEGRCDEAHALSRERPPKATVPELDPRQLQACGRAGHGEAARGLASLIEDPEARRAALVMLLL